MNPTCCAVGVWFYSLATDRYLYLMRNDPRHPGSWGLPGGKVEPGETLLTAIQRECEEELGDFPDYVRMIPLEQFTSPDERFSYHTFFCCVASEFQPRLNSEHLGYAWIDSQSWPRPMHPGLWNTVNLDEIRDKIQIIREQIHTSQ
jgi:8-oxo-dGTP pyrophosphatase MutT (NUDIX family)